MKSEIIQNLEKAKKPHIIKHKNTVYISRDLIFDRITRKGEPFELFEYLLEAAEGKIMLTAYYEVNYHTATGKYILKKIMNGNQHPLEQKLKYYKLEIAADYKELILGNLSDENIQRSKILQSCANIQFKDIEKPTSFTQDEINFIQYFREADDEGKKKIINMAISQAKCNKE